MKNYFSYFSTKTYAVGAQKNHLIETALLSTPFKMFKLIDKKIFLIIGLTVFVSRSWSLLFAINMIKAT